MTSTVYASINLQHVYAYDRLNLLPASEPPQEFIPACITSFTKANRRIKVYAKSVVTAFKYNGVHAAEPELTTRFLL